MPNILCTLIILPQDYLELYYGAFLERVTLVVFETDDVTTENPFCTVTWLWLDCCKGIDSCLHVQAGAFLFFACTTCRKLKLRLHVSLIRQPLSVESIAPENIIN